MELLGAYALDALSPAERAAVEAYLPSSPACRAELRLLRIGAAALAMQPEERAPSPELRNRLFAAIQAEPQGGAAGGASRPVATAPLPPTAPLGSTAPAEPSATEPRRPAAPVETPVAEPTRPAEPISLADARARRGPTGFPLWGQIAAALALVLIGAVLAWAAFGGDDDGEGDKVVALGQFSLTDAADPALATGGEVEYLADENIMRLTLHDLPELAEGEVFQLWVVTDDGTVLPSVVFGSGTETTEVAMVANPVGVDALALTREPGPIGSVSATTPIFAVADLDTSEVEG